VGSGHQVRNARHQADVVLEFVRAAAVTEGDLLDSGSAGLRFAQAQRRGSANPANRATLVPLKSNRPEVPELTMPMATDRSKRASKLDG
jgi:hypothetical protein